MEFIELLEPRLDKTWSCVLKTSLAASGEVMTTVFKKPSLRLMTGPYVFERLANEQCGSFPTRLMFPIRGSRGGPGGVAAIGRGFLLDLGVEMIKKHDKIKQTKRKRVFSTMMSIFFSRNIFVKMLYQASRYLCISVNMLTKKNIYSLNFKEFMSF